MTKGTINAGSSALFTAVFLLIATAALPQGDGEGKLSVASWNIKDLTLENLQGQRLDQICSTISVNTSNITFLIEVRNSPDQIGQQITTQLSKKYSFDGTWDYRWSNVGQEGNRVEYALAIIRSENKAKLTVNDFGILDRRNQYSQPWDLLKASVNGNGKRQREGPSYVGNRVPFYLDVSVERPGLQPFREVVSVWHAPGPANNPSDLWQTYKPALKRAAIGATVGDYNFNSDLREVIRPGGSTIGRNDYDGAVVLDEDNYRLADVRSLQDYDFRITDHLPARFVFEVGKRGAGKK